jgi:hypothetical protein
VHVEFPSNRNEFISLIIPCSSADVKKLAKNIWLIGKKFLYRS